jgi:hypothetical protein
VVFLVGRYVLDEINRYGELQMKRQQLQEKQSTEAGPE